MSEPEQSAKDTVTVELTRIEQRWLTSLLTAQIRDDREQISHTERQGRRARIARKSAGIYTAIAYKVKMALPAIQDQEHANA